LAKRKIITVLQTAMCAEITMKVSERFYTALKIEGGISLSARVKML